MKGMMESIGHLPDAQKQAILDAAKIIKGSDSKEAAPAKDAAPAADAKK